MSQSPPRVRARVSEVRDNGVLVKVLDSGRAGFIRRRELSWDRRVGRLPQMPMPGEDVDAVIIEDSAETGLLYLSIRRLSDPWEPVIANRKYQVGQSVSGEVVNVRRFGAFVQLEPGIDARVPPAGVPLPKDQTIEDVLWVGDQVRGVITKAELGTHEIELSLWDELRRLETVPDRKAVQLALLGGETGTAGPAGPEATDQPRIVRRFRPRIPRPQRFLVVDDDPQARRLICQRLEKEYGILADEAPDGKEAVAKVRQGLPYGLAIIDVRLDGEHGAEVAERLWALRPDLPVLYVSVAELSDRDRAAIDTSRTPLSSKEPDAIVEWIDRLCSGDWGFQESAGAESADHFVQQLGLAAFVRRSLKERLGDMLGALRQKAGVSHAIVLELDPTGRQVSVLAADPPLPDHLCASPGGLYYSPARNVIEDEEEFRRNDIQEGDAQFKNLFPRLTYRSCLGLPIRIPDHLTRHALFLLDRRAWSFDARRRKQKLQQARLAAQFLAVAIERSVLLEHMRQYQSQYADGRLLNDMVHEINNKLGGIRSQAQRLLENLPDAGQAANPPDRWLDTARDAANKIVRDEEEIKQLVQAYRRLARGELGRVSVNEAVQAAIRQLTYTAKDAMVEIVLDLADDVPPAWGIQSQLEQVILNLALNAIQQIARQHEQFEKIEAERRGDALPGRLVIVQSRYRGPGFPCPIQVRVVDTGPGVHWRDQERIYAMGAVSYTHLTLPTIYSV